MKLRLILIAAFFVVFSQASFAVQGKGTYSYTCDGGIRFTISIPGNEGPAQIRVNGGPQEAMVWQPGDERGRETTYKNPKYEYYHLQTAVESISLYTLLPSKKMYNCRPASASNAPATTASARTPKSGTTGAGDNKSTAPPSPSKTPVSTERTTQQSLPAPELTGGPVDKLGPYKYSCEGGNRFTITFYGQEGRYTARASINGGKEEVLQQDKNIAESFVNPRWEYQGGRGFASLTDMGPVKTYNCKYVPSTAPPKYPLLDQAGIRRLVRSSGSDEQLQLLRMALDKSLWTRDDYMRYFVGLNNCNDPNFSPQLSDEFKYPELKRYYSEKLADVLTTVPRTLTFNLGPYTLGTYDRDSGAFPLIYGNPPGPEDRDAYQQAPPLYTNEEYNRPYTIRRSKIKLGYGSGIEVACDAMNWGIHPPYRVETSWLLSFAPFQFRALKMAEADAEKFVADLKGGHRRIVLRLDVEVLDKRPETSDRSSSGWEEVTFFANVKNIRVFQFVSFVQVGGSFDPGLTGIPIIGQELRMTPVLETPSTPSVTSSSGSSRAGKETSTSDQVRADTSGAKAAFRVLHDHGSLRTSDNRYCMGTLYVFSDHATFEVESSPDPSGRSDPFTLPFAEISEVKKNFRYIQGVESFHIKTKSQNKTFNFVPGPGATIGDILAAFPSPPKS